MPKTYKGRQWKIVKEGTPEFQRAAAAYQRATGRRLSAYPTFWVAGTRYYTAGYSGPRELLRRIANFIAHLLNAIPQLIVGEDLVPIDQGEPKVQPETPGNPSETPPSAEPVEDWAGVHVVAVVPKQAAKIEAAIRAGRWLGRKRVQRLIDDLTGGKAKFSLLYATDPQYEPFLKAAGVADQLQVVVLVPKTAQGLVKGLVVKKVESAVGDKLKGYPVEVIFERTHPDDYEAARLALVSVPVVEGGDSSAKDGGGLSGLLPSLTGGAAGGSLAGLIAALAGIAGLRRKEKKAFAALESRLKEKLPAPKEGGGSQ